MPIWKAGIPGDHWTHHSIVSAPGWGLDRPSLYLVKEYNMEYGFSSKQKDTVPCEEHPDEIWRIQRASKLLWLHLGRKKKTSQRKYVTEPIKVKPPWPVSKPYLEICASETSSSDSSSGSLHFGQDSEKTLLEHFQTFLASLLWKLFPPTWRANSLILVSCNTLSWHLKFNSSLSPAKSPQNTQQSPYNRHVLHCSNDIHSLSSTTLWEKTQYWLYSIFCTCTGVY